MSAKNQVFLVLFQERYNADDGALAHSMVTLDEVADAIRQVNRDRDLSLSDRNPANFIKDYLRSNRRNEIWPDEIRQAGFTARQRTGAGLCFEFVPIGPGEDPFPEDYAPTGQEPTFTIQTLSLPVTTREIVRVDEQSLAQIAVKLHLLEHFLANSGSLVEQGLREITHLQNNVKLSSSEVDALYQATVGRGGDFEVGAIAVEVKIGDPIIAEQIEKQALAVLADDAFQFCLPVIVKRTRKGEVVALHLAPVRREQIVDGTIELGPVIFGARYIFVPELPKI